MVTIYLIFINKKNLSFLSPFSGTVTMTLSSNFRVINVFMVRCIIALSITPTPSLPASFPACEVDGAIVHHMMLLLFSLMEPSAFGNGSIYWVGVVWAPNRTEPNRTKIFSCFLVLFLSKSRIHTRATAHIRFSPSTPNQTLISMLCCCYLSV